MDDNLSTLICIVYRGTSTRSIVMNDASFPFIHWGFVSYSSEAALLAIDSELFLWNNVNCFAHAAFTLLTMFQPTVQKSFRLFVLRLSTILGNTGQRETRTSEVRVQRTRQMLPVSDGDRSDGVVEIFTQMANHCTCLFHSSRIRTV